MSETEDDLLPRIRAAIDAQGFNRLVGAKITELGSGHCEISIDHRAELMQQNGLFHGGVIAFLVDNAATIAAATMLTPGRTVITAEYKVNLLSPAIGERIVCRAEVAKAGKMFTVVSADVFVSSAGREKRVATALATIANLPLEAEPRDPANPAS